MDNKMMVIAETIANLAAIEKDYVEQYKGNIRECPFHSERVGMERMLKMMGIAFEYDFNDAIEPVAITVDGCTAIIK